MLIIIQSIFLHGIHENITNYQIYWKNLILFFTSFPDVWLKMNRNPLGFVLSKLWLLVCSGLLKPLGPFIEFIRSLSQVEQSIISKMFVFETWFKMFCIFSLFIFLLFPLIVQRWSQMVLFFFHKWFLIKLTRWFNTWK